MGTAPMAVAASLSFSIDPQHHHAHHRFLPQNPNLSKPLPPRPVLFLPKSRHPRFKSSFLPSDFSFPSSSPTETNRILTNEEQEKLEFLQNFSYHEKLRSGSLWVRVLRPEDMDATVELLAESYAEDMGLPVKFLGFLVKQYLLERRTAMPHAATLVGFYRGTAEEDGGEGGGAGELAGTVEVSLNEMGANASPPTPSPPIDKPYICNMSVKKHLRRRGIGWHLLKASEKLISETSSSKEVYLHCRIIDAAPFSMYSKAGYNVVNTDSILILLMFQRRKHLMCKNLPTLDGDSEPDVSSSDEELKFVN